MVLYFSHIMYKYHYHIGSFPIKHNYEVKYVHSEIFNNIPYFIKNHLRVDCLQDGFVVYKNKVILRKTEFIPLITNSMIPEDCCQKIPSIITFTNDDMT